VEADGTPLIPMARRNAMTETHDTDWPRWRGINHLALVTDDMDATVRFYHGVLGARLVATIGTPQFRHYFFEFGVQNTVAFFEYRGVVHDRLAKPAGVPDPRAVQFDHLSFNLPDEHALLEMRDRLKAAGCGVTDVVDHDFIRSIYFTDPNGIALEASWWALDATGRAADYGDERLFSDPDPVPAVRELRDEGAVRSVPHTNLV
jgi:catechol 2,3-dioxygenase-like lactoylglutathione lyase family enzyme